VHSEPTPSQEIFGIRVGYSGHELGSLPTLVAVALGATVVERHFTRDKSQEGFDHHMSLDSEELANLIRTIREVELMLGDGSKRLLESEMIARNKYRLSMVASRDLLPGEFLTTQDFHFRNPGIGIAPELADEFLGSRVIRNVAYGELILESDLQRK